MKGTLQGPENRMSREMQQSTAHPLSEKSQAYSFVLFDKEEDTPRPSPNPQCDFSLGFSLGAQSR